MIHDAAALLGLLSDNQNQRVSAHWMRRIKAERPDLIKREPIDHIKFRRAGMTESALAYAMMHGVKEEPVIPEHLKEKSKDDLQEFVNNFNVPSKFWNGLAWECPRCHTINGPMVKHCECHPPTVTITNFNTTAP